MNIFKRKGWTCFSVATALSILWILPIQAQTSSFSDSVVDGHVYNFKNVFSNAYLEVTESSITSELRQFDFLPSQKRNFKVSLADKLGDDIYYSIIPVFSDSSRLDVDNAQNTNGTKVKSFYSNDAYSQAQQFKFIDNGDNSYRIMPRLSKTKVLEVAGPSINQNASIQIWDYVGSSNQKWVMIDIDKEVSPSWETVCVPQSYPSDTTNFTIQIKNNSGIQGNYDGSFNLERFNNNQWESVAVSTPSRGESLMIIDANTIVDYALKVYYDTAGEATLPQGKYRFVIKPFNQSSDLCYAEFEIQ